MNKEEQFFRCQQYLFELNDDFKKLSKQFATELLNLKPNKDDLNAEYSIKFSKIKVEQKFWQNKLKELEKI